MGVELLGTLTGTQVEQVYVVVHAGYSITLPIYSACTADTRGTYEVELQIFWLKRVIFNEPI